MNFRLIFSALVISVLALLLFFLGLIVFIIPWAEPIRNFLIDLIGQDFYPWNLFGIPLMLFGGGLIAYLRSLKGKKFYTFYLGDLSLEISENVVKNTLESYWKSLFPTQNIPFKMHLGKKQIDIKAELPQMVVENQKILLQKIDRDLKNLLSDRLGLIQKISLEISFG